MYINEVLKEKNINKNLVEYITTNILPTYDKNNIGGHDQKHIETVISRSFELAEKFNLDVDLNMVYVIAAYHDIGYKENPDEHEQVSSEMFLKDNEIKKYFSEEQINIIAEAIIDHRASLEYEARSIYGKLVSSADREISVENMLERSIKYQTSKHKKENPTDEEIIEYSYKKLSSKYGKEGYAKMYFTDDKYLAYLSKIQKLLENKELFIKEEKKIMKQIEIENKLNKELVEYIKNNIFPSYSKNDLGHDLNHIKYVIERSFKFAEEVEDINYNMVYVIAAYHDIGHYIDAKNHEKVSSEMLLSDENLKKYFSNEEIKIMAEAVNDHRASLEYDPRSIYGKIVSSADRNVLIETPLERTYAYRIDKKPNASFEEILEESRLHILEKFGKKGYATEKMYFEDEDYKRFLSEITLLAEDKEAFKERYIQVNNIRLNSPQENNTTVKKLTKR